MSTSSNAAKQSLKFRAPFLFGSLKNAFSAFFSSSRSSTVSTAPIDKSLSNEETIPPKNRFLEAAARVFDSKHYAASASEAAPYGYFLGRHIIGDCTQISGGIFVGHQAQEAIVIDERYGILTKVYESLLEKIQSCSQNSQHAEYEIFNAVIATTTSTIALSAAEAQQFAETQLFQDDEKVSLDVYVTQGFGLDYHQVLLAAYLLEKLAKEKKIAGITSLDSTLSESSAAGLVLLYTSTSGCVLRFSPLEHHVHEIMH